MRVVARVRDVPAKMKGWKRADGEGVSFVPVPYYVGYQQFMMRWAKVMRAVRKAIGYEDAVILRVPSLLANLVVPHLLRRGQPFALQVGGDPWDLFSPGAVDFPWPVRLLARWWFVRELKKQCKAAAAIAYVTQSRLQRRYPPGGSTFSITFSDVELPHSAFLMRSWGSRSKSEPFNLITVATLHQPYKGVDVLIDAVAQCIKEGLNLRLVVVGEGKYRRSLETQSISRGLEGHVYFLGELPAGEAVREQLDQADLFVLASRQEGLPRAMLEAMARGLPCIGTTVGGIPELLPPEDLVPPNDARALARKIAEVLKDQERMVRMSQRNYQKAMEYREEVLREKRLTFYRFVRELTEEWQKTQRKAPSLVIRGMQ
ncbi:MAG: glycosyltransferase family 4 protein [Thermoproteota archaeon]